jgi:hypothetical protein
LHFEVFIAEEEWFREWWFAAGGSGGCLGSVSGRSFMEPEEAAWREFGEEFGVWGIEFGRFNGGVGGWGIPVGGPVEWVESGEGERVDEEE